MHAKKKRTNLFPVFLIGIIISAILYCRKLCREDVE